MTPEITTQTNQFSTENFAAFQTHIKQYPECIKAWFKCGHDLFIEVPSINHTGRFSGYTTKKRGKSDPKSRVRDKFIPDVFEHLNSWSETNNGGVFFIPYMPQGLPLKEDVKEACSIGVELDSFTTEEQLEIYAEFEKDSGIQFSLLLKSGGKSVHGHIWLDQMYPWKNVQYLIRLTIIALESDPVTSHAWQPMRLAGFNRYEGEGQSRYLKGHQSIIQSSKQRYTYDEVLQGLKLRYEAFGLNFPERISDAWWGRQFVPNLRSSSSLSVEERGWNIIAALGQGIENWEAEQEEKAKAREDRRQKNQLSIRGKQISDYVTEAECKLGHKAFSDIEWKWEHETKARGCCSNPEHESLSGNSAYIRPMLNESETWGYACPVCTENKAIGGFQYFWRQKLGWKAEHPQGKQYVDLAKEFCLSADIEIPKNIQKQPNFIKRIWVELNHLIKGNEDKVGELPSGVDKIYKEGNQKAAIQEAIQKSYRYVLDASGTGEGKTHGMAELTTSDFYKVHKIVTDDGGIELETENPKKIIYVNQDARNPTVEGFKDWSLYPAQHKELTINGLGQLRLAKPGDPTVTPANCKRIEEKEELVKLNVPEAYNTICQSCSFLDTCKSTPGWFKYDSMESHQAHKNISNPLSLPNGENLDYGQVTLIWDEPTVSFPITKKLTVSVTDQDKLTAKLARENDELWQQLKEFLTKLLEITKTKKNRYGIGFEEIRAALGEIPDVDYEKLFEATAPDLSILNEPFATEENKNGIIRECTIEENIKERKDEIRGKILKQWLPDLLSVLKGEIEGDIQNISETIEITQIETRFRKNAQNAFVNVFLDATLSREDLALMLGVEPAEIYVIKKQSEPVHNLKIIQIPDLGRMTKQRGNVQEQRLKALVPVLRQKHSNPAVIDFKKFVDKENKDLLQGSWVVDSRGSNQFKEADALVLVGTPCPNLGAVIAEYASLTGTHPKEDDPVFSAFVDRKIQAEFVQGLGRLRSNRREDEELTVYVISNFDLGIEGVEQVKGAAITPDAGKKAEQIWNKVQNCIPQWIKDFGQFPTQQDLADLFSVSREYISRLAKQFTGGWKAFVKLTLTLIDSPPQEVVGETTEEETRVVEEILPVIIEQSSDKVATELAVLVEVFGWDGWGRMVSYASEPVKKALLKSLFWEGIGPPLLD